MIDLSRNIAADGIGYLYRAAYYMAVGQTELALTFISKAERKIGMKIHIPENKPSRFVAEKILDQYTKLKNSLFR